MSKLAMEETKVTKEAPVTEANSESDTQVGEVLFTPEQENAVLRKFDKIVLPQCFIFLVLNYLDRSNLGNAKVFGFEKDLGLVGTQFGNINTLFYVPYVLLETPWVMCVKRFGPNKVLAVALVCWSVVTLCTGFIHTYAQAIVLRCMLGACEAGVAPGFAYIFSTIYPRESTAKRVALIYLANVTSGAFGGLFAYGVQSMGERLGLAAWRWLFIIEGIISIVICGCCWLSFPNSPETAWFLKPEEKEIMVQRKKREAIYKGDDKFDWKYAKMVFTDPFIYLASISFFCSSIAIFGFGTFLPTIIRGLGYNAFQANYLTIPVYALGAIVLVICSYYADKLGKRGMFLMFLPIPVIIGYLITVGTKSPGAGFFGMFLCCSGIYTFNSTLVTWMTINLKPDHKRSIGLPVFVSLANLSGLVAAQLYPSDQSPRYIMGNAVSAGMEALALVVIVASYFMLRRRNQIKDKLIAEGVTDNGLEGDRALDFRYAL